MSHFDSVTWGSNPDSPSYPTEGYAEGYKIARGVQTLNATNAAGGTITTGLTTVVSFSLTSLANTATLANNCALVTGSINSGSIVTKRWKVGGASTTTLEAATAAGSVYWTAIGT